MTRIPNNPSRRHDMQQDVQLFQTPDGQIHLDVRLHQDTVWLTQARENARCWSLLQGYDEQSLASHHDSESR